MRSPSSKRERDKERNKGLNYRIFNLKGRIQQRQLRHRRKTGEVWSPGSLVEIVIQVFFQQYFAPSLILPAKAPDPTDKPFL